MEFLYTLQASQSTLSMDHTKLKDGSVSCFGRYSKLTLYKHQQT